MENYNRHLTVISHLTILRLMQLAILILIIILILITLFYDSIFQRNFRRYNYYKQALKLSKKLNKKLLVVGCPWSGGFSGKISLLLKLYGCGDILIDIKKKSKCPNHVESDLKSFLTQQEDNSYVIFISVVLEYIDDIEETIIELKRVSGTNIYIVPIDIIWEKWLKINMGNYNHLDRKNLALKWTPKYNETKYKPI